MPGLIDILKQLLLNSAVLGQFRRHRSSSWRWIMAAFSFLAATLTLFFLNLALYRFFLLQADPVMAALMTAGVAACVALGCYFIFLALHCHAKRKEHEIPVFAENLVKELEVNIRTLIDSANAELEGPVRENPKLSLAIAALAGFILAPHRRG